MDIVIPIYDDFTALDAIGPYEVLSRTGGRVRFVAERAGPDPHRQRHAVGRSPRRRSPTCRRPTSSSCPAASARAQLSRGRRAGRLAARRARDDDVDDVGVHRLAAARRGGDPRRASRPRRTGCELETLRGLRRAADRASASCAQGKVITAAGVSSGIDMALTLAAAHRRRGARPRRSSSASSTTRSRRSTPARSRRPRPRAVERDPRGGRGAAARRHGSAPTCDATAPRSQGFRARRGSLRGRRYGPTPAWTCAPPSISTSASPTSGPGRRRRSRPPSPAATCWS